MVAACHEKMVMSFLKEEEGIKSFFLLKSYAFTLLSLCVLQTLFHVSKKGLIGKKFCCLGVQLEQA